MGLKMDDETLAKILGQEDYGVMENGFVLPTPTQQVPTDAERELKRQRAAAERVRLESKFRLVAIGCGYDLGVEFEWARNYKFDLPDSGMEFDFCLPDLMVAIEVNGGQGRGNESGHSSWTGLERDARKQNAAVLKGWTLFWLPTSMVNAEHVQPIIDYIIRRGNE
jgi:hypothetical protein